MEYEKIIKDIGGFGRWQKFIFFGITFPDFFTTFVLTIPSYICVTPDWGCIRKTVNNLNITVNLQEYHSTNSTIIVDDINYDDKNCSACSVRYYDDNGHTSIVSEWDLVCEKRYVSNLITSVQMGGLLLGSAIFSQLSDTFGRKKAQYLAVILIAVAGSLSSFSINWQMFIVLRFINGVCVGGYYSINNVYAMEFVSSRWRTLCGNLSPWAIAQMAFALMAYLVPNWRYLTLISSLCAMSYVGFWWVLPESPRWLIQHGHIKEAKQVLYRIAKRNGKPIPDLSHLDTLLAVSKEERNCIKNEKPALKKYTFVDLFRKKFAKTTIYCCFLWFVSFLAWYEMFYDVKNLSGNRYLNTFLGGLVDFTTTMTVIALNNVLGRKPLLMLSTAVTVAINLALLTIYATNNHLLLATWTNILGQTGRYTMGCAVGVVMVYGAEVFPTDIRNLGVGAGYVSARIGGVLAPQLMYLGELYHRTIPYAVISFLCGMIFPIYFLMVETTGKPLQDDYHSSNDQAKHCASDILNDISTGRKLKGQNLSANITTENGDLKSNVFENEQNNHLVVNGLLHGEETEEQISRL